MVSHCGLSSGDYEVTKNVFVMRLGVRAFCNEIELEVFVGRLVRLKLRCRCFFGTSCLFVALWSCDRPARLNTRQPIKNWHETNKLFACLAIVSRNKPICEIYNLIFFIVL